MADASLVVVFAVAAAGIRIALAVARSRRAANDGQDGTPHERPDPSDPRWSNEKRPPQIAGKKCAECTKRIMMVVEGEICAECEQPVHHACASKHVAAHGPTAGPFR